MNYAIIDATGLVTMVMHATESVVALNTPPGGVYVATQYGVEVGDLYVNGTFTKNVGHLKETAMEAVRRMYREKTCLPITYLESSFDADISAREHISGVLARLMRGDGLPGGWIGWRDADNQMHWASDDAETVRTHLRALASAIEDREQALLISAWRHKAVIAGLDNYDDVAAYAVE